LRDQQSTSQLNTFLYPRQLSYLLHWNEVYLMDNTHLVKKSCKELSNSPTFNILLTNRTTLVTQKMI